MLPLRRVSERLDRAVVARPQPAPDLARLLGAIVARGGSLGSSCPSCRTRAMPALFGEVERVAPVEVPVLRRLSRGLARGA
ncbi:MAG: hypothetical protein A3K12_12600 [Candidatus Rokubacteria bacterium RIFCSPLOWO2_12_FULL_71_19]|nr:MAG: hypothetical protein A3K12_12600 [Candidatus Rokubacteria bacterium RIFCSPLOWO2_12_FULL_71_19]